MKEKIKKICSVDGCEKKLRPHQEQFNQICQAINNGEKITDVIAFVNPGGGKSVYMSIASQLIKDDNTKLLWICPRESLVSQAEKGFRGDGIFDVGNHDIRIAGNNGDVFRGNSGAVCTYQSVIAYPELWINVSKKYKLILFLDEYDSISLNSIWGKPIEQIYNNSFFRICATGTIDRSDLSPLMFTPYNKDGSINFNNTKSRKWIIYDSKQSIKDGSTVPIKANLISGSGSYMDTSGFKRDFKSFTGDGDQLLTAFKTGFAYQIFKLCLSDWKKYKKKHPWAKMIVLGNNIDIANQYNAWFRNEGYRFNIATSGDEKLSKETIRRFKLDNSDINSYDGMIGIGKVYKGLDIKQATFLVFLINFRGKSWVFQALGRVQRSYKGLKKECFLYAPNDPKMKLVLKQLKCGIINNVEFGQEQIKPEKTESNGEAPKIQPLRSEAKIDHLDIDLNQASIKPEVIETQSEKETRLRKQINSVIRKIVKSEDNGNKNTKSKIYWLRVKQIVNNGRCEKTGKLLRKKIEEMTIKELEKVAEFSEIFN